MATTSPPIGEVIGNITDDLKTIARDEVGLVKLELKHAIKMAALDAALIIVGGVVALTGVSLLCVALVVALAPVIPPLWLRLVVVAIAYLAVGAGVIAMFVKRLKKDVVPSALPIEETKEVIASVKDGLSRQESSHV